MSPTDATAALPPGLQTHERRLESPTAPAPKAAEAGSGPTLFGDDGFTFWDALDIVNPLQHIPVVNTIYRELTGDAIDPGAQLAGGALFGGVPGLIGAGVNAVVKGETGRDIGEHVLALFQDDPADGAAEGPMLADADADTDADPAQRQAFAATPMPQDTVTREDLPTSGASPDAAEADAAARIALAMPPLALQAAHRVAGRMTQDTASPTLAQSQNQSHVQNQIQGEMQATRARGFVSNDMYSAPDPVRRGDAPQATRRDADEVAALVQTLEARGVETDHPMLQRAAGGGPGPWAQAGPASWFGDSMETALRKYSMQAERDALSFTDRNDDRRVADDLAR